MIESKTTIEKIKEKEDRKKIELDKKQPIIIKVEKITLLMQGGRYLQ